MPSGRSLYLPAILLTCLAPLGLGAQGERIRIRLVPAPHQLIRLEFSQDMNLDAVVPGMGLDALRITGKTTFAGTQRTGAPDARGWVTAEFTYEEAAVDMTTNGAPITLPADLNRLKGKTATYVYDGDGKLVDIRIPEEAGLDSSMVKQLIQGLSASLPNTTLLIGETVSVPATMSMAIPLPGGEAGKPMNLETRNTFKLVSVRRDGADRIAVLDQAQNGRASYTMGVPGGAGGATANLELRMTGRGTLEVNLDKGFVTSGTTNADLDMNMIMQSPNGPMTITITGTIKIVITGVSRPAP